jgi:hypothetical protein
MRPRKRLVEESFALRITRVREALAARLAAPALVRAQRRDDGVEFLELRLTPRARGAVTVAYRLRDRDLVYSIALRSVAQHFGGVRWFLECPRLTPTGEPCSRRVRTLYLPPGEWYLGCVVCFRLTWKSVQRPATARVHRLCEALAIFADDLDHPDPIRRTRAVVSTRALVESVLTSS